MNSRRRFIAGASLLVFAAATNAQTLLRIGLLSIGTDPVKPNLNVWVPFLDELRRLGYEEGRNIAIERRFAGGQQDRMAEFVADLARLHVDVVVATGDIECIAARRAMPATPLVMVLVQDPVAVGLVASLAQPGGNVTGVSTLAPETYAKRLQLLKEMIPAATRVGILINPTTANASFAAENLATAAHILGVQLYSLNVRNPQEVESAFSAAAQDRLQALVVLTDGVLFSQRARIAELAAHGRLPAIYESRDFAEAGGLIAYGPSYSALAIRAATYVDRILSGARPADLPVEQPTKFELIVNVKAAKALGLSIPPSILLRADRAIE